MASLPKQRKKEKERKATPIYTCVADGLPSISALASLRPVTMWVFATENQKDKLAFRPGRHQDPSLRCDSPDVGLKINKYVPRIVLQP